MAKKIPMMTDSRQQGKVKYAFKDILGIVFFGVLAKNDDWEESMILRWMKGKLLTNSPNNGMVIRQSPFMRLF